MTRGIAIGQPLRNRILSPNSQTYINNTGASNTRGHLRSASLRAIAASIATAKGTLAESVTMVTSARIAFRAIQTVPIRRAPQISVNTKKDWVSSFLAIGITVGLGSAR